MSNHGSIGNLQVQGGKHFSLYLSDQSLYEILFAFIRLTQVIANNLLEAPLLSPKSLAEKIPKSSGLFRFKFRFVQVLSPDSNDRQDWPNRSSTGLSCDRTPIRSIDTSSPRHLHCHSIPKAFIHQFGFAAIASGDACWRRGPLL